MSIQTNRPLAIWLTFAATVCALWAIIGGQRFESTLLSFSAISNAILAVYLWRHADERPIWRKRQD